MAYLQRTAGAAGYLDYLGHAADHAVALAAYVRGYDCAALAHGLKHARVFVGRAVALGQVHYAQ